MEHRHIIHPGSNRYQLPSLSIPTPSKLSCPQFGSGDQEKDHKTGAAEFRVWRYQAEVWYGSCNASRNVKNSHTTGQLPGKAARAVPQGLHIWEIRASETSAKIVEIVEREYVGDGCANVRQLWRQLIRDSHRE